MTKPSKIQHPIFETGDTVMQINTRKRFVILSKDFMNEWIYSFRQYSFIYGLYNAVGNGKYWVNTRMVLTEKTND